MITRPTRTRQPQGELPRIDWSNPITRGLELCAVPVGGTFLDVVTGVMGTPSGTITPGVYTRNNGYSSPQFVSALKADSGASVVWPASATLRGGSLTASTQGTLLALAGFPNSTDGNKYSVIGSTENATAGDGPTLIIDSFYLVGRGNIAYGRYQNPVGVSQQANGIGTAFENQLHWFGYGFNSSEHCYFRGRDQPETVASGVAIGSVITNRQAWIFRHDTANSGSVDCYVALGLIWNRRLSAAENASLHDNPWQLFEPRRIFLPLSAGGGATFNPAWARQRSGILGAGLR